MDSEIYKIIRNHENQNVEFKESFRWNDFKKQIDRSIPKKITSAICGFLASKEGGKVIIGVKDNKKIIGIDSDIMSYNKKDPLNGRDCLLTDIGEKIRKNISIKVISYCSISFKTINEKDIIVIDVNPYERPVIHLSKELYVRVANSTKKLVGREAYDYLKTNYSYNKFRFDIEYVFFNIMRYFRVARIIILKKKEKYYSLISNSIIFNLFWYIYLFADYNSSQYLFPISLLTIFLFTLNFDLDLFYEYKNSPKKSEKSYIPTITKKIVIYSFIFLGIISGLLSILLSRVILLMISEIKFLILYLGFFLLVTMIYIITRRTLKGHFIEWEEIQEKYFKVPQKFDKLDDL